MTHSHCTSNIFSSWTNEPNSNIKIISHDCSFNRWSSSKLFIQKFGCCGIRKSAKWKNLKNLLVQSTGPLWELYGANVPWLDLYQDCSKSVEKTWPTGRRNLFFLYLRKIFLSKDTGIIKKKKIGLTVPQVTVYQNCSYYSDVLEKHLIHMYS